jgi:hypothetical protein
MDETALHFTGIADHPAMIGGERLDMFASEADAAFNR